MKIRPSVLALTATVVAVATVALAASAASGSPSADGEQARIERGKYLVDFIGCNDCHTPWKMGENGPEPEMSRYLSGHPQQLETPPAPALPQGYWGGGTMSVTFTAWAGPWGTSFTRNLTPDKETGLGSWTEKEFIDTIRNGRERGIGREILPPMPWPSFGKMTDEDLSAIWAYLQTIPAISNRVPDNIPPAAPPAGD